MRLLATLLASCLASASAGGSYYYWYYPNSDAPEMDIEHLSGHVDDLMAACDSLSGCQGFNSDGWLKNCTTSSCITSPASCGLYVKHSSPMPAGLWPLPSSVSGVDGSVMSIDSKQFTITASPGSSSPVLEGAIARYSKIFFIPKRQTPPLPPSPPMAAAEVSPSGSPSTPSRQGARLVYREDPSGAVAATGVVITVSEVEPPLQMGVDESYTLDTTSPTITISAKTTWGALRGLERLSQLVWWTATSQTSFTVFEGKISDSPRFSHRGMLVDSARHFLRVDALQMAVDALVYNFFSVLHWHIVDDQSFPYNSSTFPELAGKGAYNSPASTHVYSQEDVQTVISYAHARGIRVLIEFDTPGHTQSWGISHPELLVPCYSNGQPDGSRYGMNPLLNSTYDFMTKFFGEVSQVFPDDYVHVGGDELSLGSGSCWTTNPDLQQWMKEHGKTDYAALENVYEQRLVNIVNGTGKSIIGWQELFDNGIDLPPAFVVNVWKGGWQDEMASVTKKFRAVLSSPYYENYIQNPYSNGGDWKEYYTPEPLNFSGTAEQKARVMGCEVSFWAEFIDATNLFSRAWPRAAAAGERFWSPLEQTTDPNAAAGRFHSHRCRLLTRNIPAETVEGPSFCYDEYDVGYVAPY